MRFSFKKFVTMLLPLLSQLDGSSANTSRKELPPGCKGLDIIYGDINARHIIFGEIHQNQNCYAAINRCLQNLL